MERGRKMASVSKATIYVAEKIWNEFRAICKRNDTSASREIRRFVRERVIWEGKGARKKPRKKS